MCVLAVPIGGSSRSNVASLKKEGWKRGREEFKLHGNEAKEHLAIAARSVLSGVFTIVVLPKGNPLWGRDYVRNWAESFDFVPVRLCACAESCDSHSWIAEIFMHARFGPEYFMFFSCNKTKVKHVASQVLPSAIAKVIMTLCSDAAFGSQ